MELGLAILIDFQKFRNSVESVDWIEHLGEMVHLYDSHFWKAQSRPGEKAANFL
jgi:hypothetical protein